MAKLEIAGKKADLVLDMTSWEAFEEQVGRLDEMDDLMESRERLKHMRMAAEIFSAEGERLGRGETMTADWLQEHCPPKKAREVMLAIRLAVVEGMKLETAEEQKDGGAVDVTLAAIEKKENQDA